MKQIGFILLVTGFLLGAYATALDIETTNWLLFLPGAVAAAAGVVLLKRAAKGHATSEQVLSANKRELSDSLNNVVAALDSIRGHTDTLDTDTIRHEIDARLRDDLRRFADARESMVHLFGIQTYADVMSDFAAGERAVNRAWSASTDGYRREALHSLEVGAQRLQSAKSRFEAAK